MGLISPKELYEEPKLWLSVPHELHVGSLLRLMCQIYPDFVDKLHGIHCYACEGKEPIEVWYVATRSKAIATGHVDYPEKQYWLKRESEIVA